MSLEQQAQSVALSLIPENCPAVTIGIDKPEDVIDIRITKKYEAIGIAGAKCYSANGQNQTCMACPLFVGQTISLNNS